MRHSVLCLTILACLGTGQAQDDAGNENIALTYHKVTGESLDFAAIAQNSSAVQRATNFDKPDALKAEIARLQTKLAAVNPAQDFTMRVNDSISEYDHDHAEFSIQLFSPGHFVPIQAFGQQYQLAFSNAESLRAIPMSKEQARDFDAKLRAIYRSVVDEIHFKITGKGDPSGGVTGQRVIRAEITSARIIDRDGAVVHMPHVVPCQPAAPAGGAFDITRADIAGLRVGVKAKDLEGTLNRLFGRPLRRKASQGFAAVLAVNEMGCQNIPDGRHHPTPGMVCVVAYLDSDDVVRYIRMERIFPYLDSELFRKSLTQKYGAVASAQGGGNGFSLGWGPEVKSAQTGPTWALTAQYATSDDFMSRSGNRIPDVRLSLNLVDAAWISARKQ